MKSSKLSAIISVLSLIFMLIGGTFSFFTVMNGSTVEAVTTGSAVIGADLAVSPLYVGQSLIPMNDEDIWKAYESECVDINGYGACNAYNVDIDNLADELEYQLKINFAIEEITNLNFILLDEDDNVYQETTRIVSGEDMIMGDPFVLPVDGERHFKLLIWLSNYDYDQNEEDAGGTYGAQITLESVTGYMLTGTLVNNG